MPESSTQTVQPEQGDKKVAKKTTAAKTLVIKSQSSMRRCVKEQLWYEFSGNARIGQLAAGAIADMIITLSKNIIKKAIVLLRLGNRKTLSGNAIIVAAKAMMTSPSVEAQEAWIKALSDGNNGDPKRMEAWMVIRNKMEEARRGEGNAKLKAHIDEVFQAKPYLIYIRPTLMQRIIREHVPKDWRVAGYDPAVALAGIAAQICSLIAGSILNTDASVKKLLENDETFTLAPKHVLRGIKGNMILPQLLGCSTISIVNAPIGLISSVTKKKRRHSKRAQGGDSQTARKNGKPRKASQKRRAQPAESPSSGSESDSGPMVLGEEVIDVVPSSPGSPSDAGSSPEVYYGPELPPGFVRIARPSSRKRARGSPVVVQEQKEGDGRRHSDRVRKPVERLIEVMKGRGDREVRGRKVQ